MYKIVFTALIMAAGMLSLMHGNACAEDKVNVREIINYRTVNAVYESSSGKKLVLYLNGRYNFHLETGKKAVFTAKYRMSGRKIQFFRENGKSFEEFAFISDDDRKLLWKEHTGETFLLNKKARILVARKKKKTSCRSAIPSVLRKDFKKLIRRGVDELD